MKHEAGFPDASALRSVVSSEAAGLRDGRGRRGEVVRRICRTLVRAVDKADARPLWIAAWGGTHTLAQALMDVRASRSAIQVDDFVWRIRVVVDLRCTRT